MKQWRNQSRLNSRYINFVVLKAVYFLKPNQRIVKQTGDNDKDPVNLEMLFICSTEFS